MPGLHSNSGVTAAVGPTLPAAPSEWEFDAMAGDSFAQNLAGMAYKHGVGVRQDHGASILWFHLAAAQGEADAQFNLALVYDSRADGLYRERRAAPADDEEAFKWYRLSAEQGHAGAQVRLAQMYAQGRGVKAADPVQAYKWLTLAAARGEAAATRLRAKLVAGMTREQIAAGDRQARASSLRVR